MEAVLTQHIVMTPGTCGGKPRTAGTRIRVHDIVVYHLEQGIPVAELVSEDHFSFLTEADIYAALAFYYDNRALIEQIMDDEEHAEERFRRDHPDRVIELPRA
ncbi:MAG: DUF433 domain-containing protein [Dehalococcoidia bacterium]